MEIPQSLILIVEDNKDISDNIVLSLNLNNFETITAYNGKEALKKLELLNNKGLKPDLIISDIMMPEMDGYQFFKELSTFESWNDIPFIFLTALASPEDIRLGKMLGASDYITKPFREDDLLASVMGKLAKIKKSVEITKKVNLAIKKLNLPILISKRANEIFLIISTWDEEKGPVLGEFFTTTKNPPFDPHQLSVQLFQSTTSIYGFSGYSSAEGLLINIKNIDQKGYIFFDTIQDDTVRGGKMLFMFSVIATRISYIESLKIRKIMEKYAVVFKKNNKILINEFFNQIEEILTSLV